ncbi:MAG: citrate synthase family protein [Anaerolineae bacterium]|nr:citrate synthase family protein [Anaerolineae bacterium]MDW8171765.1 citrate synthase family protein [Anaerolineae bacterium]
MSAKERYLSASEAASALGVSMQTLYAYVSRGLIRSEAGHGRQRRYRADDVQRLLARKELRRSADLSVEDALYWGAPLLDSALTLIEEGQVYYRGRKVADLAAQHSFEEVAALLWTGDPSQAQALFQLADERIINGRYETILLHLEVDGLDLLPLHSLQSMLPLASLEDPSAYDLRATTVAQSGARILRLMGHSLVGEIAADRNLADALQQGWCPEDESAATIFNCALIACADHELNASTFAARVAASTGANPYAVVTAGLAALGGVKHGGYTERVESLFQGVESPAQLRESLTQRLRRGEDIPGFGHHLYPQGDPRAVLILESLARSQADKPAFALVQTAIEAAEQVIGERPTLDFALAALALTLGLPRGSALALFALGRTAGWIGHAIEQYAADRMIRPRARYSGELPH